MAISNRVTALTGTEYPIIQAPMGWIARAQLASAVTNAGGMGIIETSSGELDNIKAEVAKMRDLTDKPFGMNVALSYVRGSNIIDFVIEQGIKFVTTSSGSPKVCTKDFQDAGISVFHVVPTLDMALKALDAGVDGLIVEGGEGGGFKNPSPVSTMVLLPLIRSHCDVPIIAAGGISDGASMAASFADGCRRGADGHAHVSLRRVAGAQQLERCHCRFQRDRYGIFKSAGQACSACLAHGIDRWP
jgi:enoyl-[acyl-carrier protein] reductase II